MESTALDGCHPQRGSDFQHMEVSALNKKSRDGCRKGRKENAHGSIKMLSVQVIKKLYRYAAVLVHCQSISSSQVGFSQ